MSSGGIVGIIFAGLFVLVVLFVILAVRNTRSRVRSEPLSETLFLAPESKQQPPFWLADEEGVVSTHNDLSHSPVVAHGNCVVSCSTREIDSLFILLLPVVFRGFVKLQTDLLIHSY
jgi:hypothetical protein